MANGSTSPSAIASSVRWLRIALRSSTVAAAAAAADSEQQPPASELPLPPQLLMEGLSDHELLALLADGRLLCRLLERLRPAETPNTCSDDGAAAKDEAAEQPAGRLVAKFLDACAKELRLPKECLFQPVDLTGGPEANPVKVLRCLRAISRTDAAAAAGLQVLPLGDIGEPDASEYVGMPGGSGDAHWDSPVLDALDQLVGFFRACRVLAKELRESPLSLWPADTIEAVIGPSHGLLKLLLGLRSALRDGEPLYKALEDRQEQLLSLYARQQWHLNVKGKPALDALVASNKACAVQAKLALAKLPEAGAEWMAKSVEDLQMAPAAHVKRLLQATNRALDGARGRSAEAAQRLERAAEVLQRVEQHFSHCMSNMCKELQPSCEAFARLKWPQQLKPPPLETLGQLLHMGHLLGADGKRVHAILWSHALVVLKAPDPSGEVLEKLDIKEDMKFEEEEQKQLAAAFNKRRNFRVTSASLKQPKLFGCETAEIRKNWLAELAGARDACFPAGFNKHGHSYRLEAVPPECMIRACLVCMELLTCWALRCLVCGDRRHVQCVAAKSGGGGPMLPCRGGSIRSGPVPKPRPRRRDQSDLCEKDPLDATAAEVRLRELSQGGGRRNFLLCPSVGSASSISPSSCYLLYVLSGNSVVTYSVEAVDAEAPAAADSDCGSCEERKLRVAGAEERFSGISDLVTYYTANLLPPLDCEDECLYQSLAEKLVL